MTLGPVMLDVAGLVLSATERQRLAHPAVGGVILFARNYDHPDQLRRLTEAIRQERPELLIAVDHEGGRVQRFREGLTAIPAMATWGQLAEHSPQQALEGARACGIVIAWELGQLGVDFSFTPVLDLDHGRSAVIGSRAFHASPDWVTPLARALVGGLQGQGMATVAKHFPGHGYVTVDSHHALPCDERSLQQLEQQDLLPFAQLLAAHEVDAVMPAHIVYPAVDPAPAGFSAFWINHYLRQRLGFEGLVISDDLTMGGAAGWGDMGQRAQAALAAGCDALLVCNDAAAAAQVLDAVAHDAAHPERERRWGKMRRRAVSAPWGQDTYEAARASLQPWQTGEV